MAREKQNDSDRNHCEEKLDEALEESFPASDVPAITIETAKPCEPERDRDRREAPPRPPEKR